MKIQSLTLMALITLPLLADPLYWGGGKGGWTKGPNWHTTPDRAQPAQPWVQGSDAVISTGTPVVDAHVVVGALRIDQAAAAHIGEKNEVLEVQGEMEGAGQVVFTRRGRGTSALLVKTQDALVLPWSLKLSDTHNGWGELRVGGGGTVTFNGSIQAEGRDFELKVQKDTELVIGPDARINNNKPDLINARPFTVTGEGTTSVLRFHPDFNADLADPTVRVSQFPLAVPNPDPDDPFYVKPVGGMSTLRAGNVTLVTTATQNLPTIHKYTGGEKHHTHHGLLTFTVNAPPPAWVVDGQPQRYDSGVYWRHDWVLETRKDLRIDALWHEGVNIGFGNWGGEDTTLTKRGGADLILNATQAYLPGTTLRVEEGGVQFLRDPDISSTPEALKANGFIKGTGNHLELELGDKGKAVISLTTPNTASLKRIHSTGMLILTIPESLPDNTPVLKVSGKAEITGKVYLDFPEDLRGKEVRILAADELVWKPQSISPTVDLNIQKRDNEIWAVRK